MADLRGMQNAVETMVTTAIYKRTENLKAKRGIYSGGSVTIGNRVYPASVAVDIPFTNGDSVWAIIADSENRAVVVGV